jgi:hypothetical protein
MDRVHEARLADERVRVCTATAYLATREAHSSRLRVTPNVQCSQLTSTLAKTPRFRALDRAG